MNRIELLINSFDAILDSSRKRHIAGGILMSTSMLFAGLAITVISLKRNREKGDK